jgi:hypothetical protein
MREKMGTVEEEVGDGLGDRERVKKSGSFNLINVLRQINSFLLLHNNFNVKIIKFSPLNCFSPLKKHTHSLFEKLKSLSFKFKPNIIILLGTNEALKNSHLKLKKF